ncbi:geranylgeranylglycerol-phosphate geranylgeranyltransferase [Methanobacterium sp. CWC-01]|uniref:UbiA family prenyltransferase n=1 Tax=Methanobacterium aridiramus TaxID=2584467 RepID=UPI002574EDB1|nr:UbiA family prenyltransferase [Methanobacterium sp. CWC-01]WJI09918.1 geranylgeranylglycerol-phosphate geranylgeranyltransferase [Methanobacterium sp. CWC-01]
MNAYLEILRPFNALMAVVAILLMAIISGQFTMDVFLAGAVVFIVTGAGNSINDYFDHKIDAINKPERPIPSGRIPLRTAGIYSSALFMVGIILAFLINTILGAIALLSSLMMMWYAYCLKRMLIVGNLAISFLTGLCFVFGGIVVDQIMVSIYLGFFAFLMTMAREIVKDMEDVKGDQAEGASTLPIVYGNVVSSKLAAFFMIIASLASPLLYIRGVFTWFYLIILIPAILIFLYGAVRVLKDQSVKNTRNVSKKIKMGMGVTFLAFAAGSPYLWSLLW